MVRMLSIPVNIVKQAVISASFEIPIITATQLNREAYRKEKDKEFGIKTVSESIQKVFISDFGAVIHRTEGSKNGPNEDQPPNPLQSNFESGEEHGRKDREDQFLFRLLPVKDYDE